MGNILYNFDEFCWIKISKNNFYNIHPASIEALIHPISSSLMFLLWTYDWEEDESFYSWNLKLNNKIVPYLTKDIVSPPLKWSYKEIYGRLPDKELKLIED